MIKRLHRRVVEMWSGRGDFEPSHLHLSTPLRLFCRKGQATSEMLFLAPFFVILIGGAISVVYLGWQNLKVQQAANVAARIQGQERVGGGKDFQSIMEVNGQLSSGDNVYANAGEGSNGDEPPGDSVYGHVYQMVKKKFYSPSEEKSVFVPKPTIGQNVDEVQVYRFVKLPKIPFMNRNSDNQTVRLEGKAWGGEDTYMYGLPRWGKTGNNNGGLEWQRLIKNSATNQD